METTISIDLAQIAREVGLPAGQVERTVELLDDGNTVPFITRYRKDQTGGFDEEQVRQIQLELAKHRQLADRKQTVLKSIESQGKLTDELAVQIRSARSAKRLEDLYLPFKPKKHTLATLARRRGLEPLAIEIEQNDPAATDLRARAELLVDPENQLPTVDDVLAGVGHLLAERFGERADVRGKLRRLFYRSGKLITHRIEPTPAKTPETTETATTETATTETATTETATTETATTESNNSTATDPPSTSVADREDAQSAEATTDDVPPAEIKTAEIQNATTPPTATQDGEAQSVAPDPADAEPDVATNDENPPQETQTQENPSPEDPPTEKHSTEPKAAEDQPAEDQPAEDQPAETQPAETQTAETQTAETQPAETQPAEAQNAETRPTAVPPVESEVEPRTAEQGLANDSPPLEPPAADRGDAAAASADTPATAAAAQPASGATAATDAPPLAKVTARVSTKLADKSTRAAAREARKHKKRQMQEAAFKDYFDFREQVSRIPPHRVLAINRGERARIIKVKIEVDTAAMIEEASALLIPAEHPHAEFLSNCVRDSLHRLIIPSLEREVRRELTERAEQHAVEVFVRNLRKLLLQPPVAGRRVLAVDPGFRSGCKMTALDEHGNVLGHDVILVVGKPDRIKRGRAKMCDLVRRFNLDVVAIGNGSGCRETERLVADVIAGELKDRRLQFVIVNEAGASVYSTSPAGREELPDYDATLRGAVSIGRRLLDPLSELVKINPSNIGVGMYQHDVKAKHLRESLDAVVESCVNYVGVDVNTASPALLRYVSGLNQLTARRIYERRRDHGPFRSREQFKEVAGFGEAAFVQAAGFLKITGGDNPLDATWIHPESYETARRVLEKLGSSVEELSASVPKAPIANTAAPPQTSETAPSGPSVSEATPAETTQSEATPAEATPAEATPAEATPAEATPAEATPTEATPTEATPTEATPAEATPAEATPAEATPTEATPTEATPTEATPAEATPAEATPAEATPAEATPAEATPAEATPAEATTNEAAAPEAVASETAAPTGDQETAVAGDPPADAPSPLAQRIANASVDELASELGVGQLLLEDILAALKRPGRDPREDLPPPVFRSGIMKLEDLQSGMELTGTVLNVVDFGAFVDIGLTDSGLVHISRLADRFVRDPHEVVSVGDTLRVWVVEVDKTRRRVSLTAIQPGTEKAKPKPTGGHKPRGERKKKASAPRRAKSARQGGRPPRSGRPTGGAPRRPAPKPKPVKPITKEMEEGVEPMRSFSDLLQFYDKKRSDDPEEEKRDG